MRLATTLSTFLVLFLGVAQAHAQGQPEPPPPAPQPADRAPLELATGEPADPTGAPPTDGPPPNATTPEPTEDDEETIVEGDPEVPYDEDDDDYGDRGGMHGFELITLRGALSRASVGDESDSGIGFLLANRSLIFGSSDALSYRAFAAGDIGGGTGGFEGQLRGEAAFGLQAYLSGRHGAFLRAGARGEMLGNDVFYQSLIMLPDAQLGYQHMNSEHGFELGARAGAGVAGRHNAGGFRRALGSSIVYGAFLNYGREHFELGASWVRIDGQKDEPSSPVDLVEGMLCLSGELESPEVPVALCADGRYARGEVQLRGGSAIRNADVIYAGVTLGIGGSTTED